MNTKTGDTLSTFWKTLTLSALLTTVAPFAMGSTDYKKQIPVGAQIRAAELLAIIEIQDYPNMQPIKLDVSGISGQERYIADMPFKIVDLLKHNPDIKLPESPTLRVAAKADSKNGDELVFPAKLNQQILVSLTPDVLTRYSDDQTIYAVKQDTFHLVEGDAVQILYQGQVVDTLHLDDVRKLVDADADRRKRLAALAEGDDVNKDHLPITEIQEQKD